MLPPGPDSARLGHAGTSSRNRSSRPLRRCSSRTSDSPAADDLVADDVERPVVLERDQHDPTIQRGIEATTDERIAEPVLAFLDLDREDPRPGGEVGEWRRPQQPAGVDGDEEVADPFDLAEQVARDDDRDPELRAGPPDQRQHLVAAGRVEAVGRLVEEQQPRDRGRAPGRA